MKMNYIKSKYILKIIYIHDIIELPSDRSNVYMSLGRMNLYERYFIQYNGMEGFV